MNKPFDVQTLTRALQLEQGEVSTLKIELIETPLDVARSLADLAFLLDEAKFAFPVEMHAQALACAETMYGMANVLAGNRAEKIIGDSDGSETQLREVNGWRNL